MARPVDPEKRAEFLRLIAGLDLYRDWHMQRERRARGPDHVIDPDEFVEPGQVWIARFDAKPEHATFWIKEVRTWYAYTASDLRYFVKLSEADNEAVRAFLDEFRVLQGYDFMSESADLRKLTIKVLNRGKIASKKEYEDLAEILKDQDQSIITHQEVRRLENLIAAFGHTR